MTGKILKIFSNDLYGNVDDRKIALFAAFDHKKYSNKYCIFNFDGDTSKKLYYGSIHFKDDTLIIFEVQESAKEYIDKFVADYLADSVSEKEYEILDVSKLEKAELVSSTEVEFDKIKELDKKSISRPKETKIETPKKNSYSGLYFILVLLILLVIGLIYVYFNPETLTIKLKQLNCTKNDYSEKLELNYVSNKIVKFDKDKYPVSIDVTDTYQFTSLSSYTEFKENSKESTSFNKEGEFKYDDTALTLKIFYNEKTIIDNYDELYNYITKEGYTCEEGTYEK